MGCFCWRGVGFVGFAPFDVSWWWVFVKFVSLIAFGGLFCGLMGLGFGVGFGVGICWC